MPKGYYTFRWKGAKNTKDVEDIQPRTPCRNTTVRGRWTFTQHVYDDNVLVRVIHGDARAMRRFLNGSKPKSVVKRKKVGTKTLRKKKK